MNPPSAPLWQTHLAIESAEVTEYHEFVHPQFLSLLTQTPSRVLDVGCAAGAVGAALKQRFPQCEVLGIELNRAAAERARQRLDRVFDHRFEEIDFANEGIAPGSVDAVILADVLEHLYNPWQLLAALREWIAADAQVLISLPNTRHLGLGAALLDRGEWRYSERGLLDITHLRFFTAAGIREMLSETGFRVERMVSNPDPNLVPIFEQSKNQPRSTVRFGRMVLENLSPAEIGELCTWQYFVLARPA